MNAYSTRVNSKIIKLAMRFQSLNKKKINKKSVKKNHKGGKGRKSTADKLEDKEEKFNYLKITVM